MHGAIEALFSELSGVEGVEVAHGRLFFVRDVGAGAGSASWYAKLGGSGTTAPPARKATRAAATVDKPLD